MTRRQGGCLLEGVRAHHGGSTPWPKVLPPHRASCDIFSFWLLLGSIFLHISLLKSRAQERELELAFCCPGHGPCLGADSGSQLESRGRFQEVGGHGVGDSGRRAMDDLGIFWGHQSTRP